MSEQSLITLGIWFASVSFGIGVALIRDSNKNKVEIQNCRKQLKKFKAYNSSLSDSNRRG